MAFFSNFNKNIHTYRKGKYVIQKYWEKTIVLDWGIHDPCSIHWYAIDERGKVYCYKEYYQTGKNVEDVAKIIIDMSAGEDINKIVLPHDMFRKSNTQIRDGRGEIFADTTADVISSITNLSVIKAETRPGVRVEGFNAVHRMLYYDREAEIIEPNIQIDIDACPKLVEQLEVIERDVLNPNDIKKYQEDHAIDDLRYFCITHYAGTKTYIPKDTYKIGTIGYSKQLEIENDEYEDDEYSAAYY